MGIIPSKQHTPNQLTRTHLQPGRQVACPCSNDVALGTNELHRTRADVGSECRVCLNFICVKKPGRKQIKLTRDALLQLEDNMWELRRTPIKRLGTMDVCGASNVSSCRGTPFFERDTLRSGSDLTAAHGGGPDQKAASHRYLSIIIFIIDIYRYSCRHESAVSINVDLVMSIIIDISLFIDKFKVYR